MPGYSTSSESALGDIRFVTRYKAFPTMNNAGIIAGIKLPTGYTGTNFSGGDAAGQPLDAGLQNGTGSVDVIYGAYYTGSISHYGWFVQGTGAACSMDQLCQWRLLPSG